MRSPILIAVAALASISLAACGSSDLSVPESDADAREGAEIFAQRCSGCHTFEAAGSQGSGNRTLRQQGPNFDQRMVDYSDALYAIRNGGFSGVLMPQNIVVGDEAAKVASFIADYSGTDVEEVPTPDQGE